MGIIWHLVFLALLCEQTVSGRLLAVLLDGFRWDYLERGLALPGFTAISARGARVKRLLSSFPSNTYPNYYSLFTGLHAESHGLVGNTFYDVTTGKMYTPSDTSLALKDRSFIYDDAEPLWITTVKQNKKAYMFHCYDCDVPIQGRLPTYCRKYNSNPSTLDFRRALGDSVELFTNSTADLSVVYFENVDDTGHKYGPNSSNVNKAVQVVDAELSRLMEKISEAGLDKEVDVMIFSDHGMTPVSLSRVVNISDVVYTPSIDAMVRSTGYVFIWPKEGQLDEVYATLTSYSPHLTVYRRGDVPERWHFRHHRRIPPILVVADVGWYIVTFNFDYYYYPDTDAQRGSHGYDPQDIDMGAFFTAVGPSFIPGTSTETLSNVNLYQIMCNSLGIKPRSHNGTWSRVSHMISRVSRASCVTSSTLLFFSLLIFGKLF